MKKTLSLWAGLKAASLGGLAIIIILILSQIMTSTDFANLFTIIVEPLLTLSIYITAGALASNWVLQDLKGSYVDGSNVIAGIVAVFIINIVGSFARIFLAFLPSWSIPNFMPSFQYSATSRALNMVIALAYGALSANIWATLKTNSGSLTIVNSDAGKRQVTQKQDCWLFTEKFAGVIGDAALALFLAFVVTIPGIIIVMFFSSMFGAIYGFASSLPNILRDNQFAELLWQETWSGAGVGLVEGILPGTLISGVTIFILTFGYFFLVERAGGKWILLIFACLGIGIMFLASVKTYQSQEDIQIIKHRYVRFQQALYVGQYEIAYEFLTPGYRQNNTVDDFKHSFWCSLEELHPKHSISISGDKATLWPSQSDFMDLIYAGSILELEKIDGVWYFTGECSISLD